jgi:hypothetical protein
MQYMITWNERQQGSPIEYENAQKRILEVFSRSKCISSVPCCLLSHSKLALSSPSPTPFAWNSKRWPTLPGGRLEVYRNGPRWQHTVAPSSEVSLPISNGKRRDKSPSNSPSGGVLCSAHSMTNKTSVPRTCCCAPQHA